MATYLFGSITAEQAAAFNPAVDVLIITGSAASVQVIDNGTSTTFVQGDNTVTVNAAIRSLTSTSIVASDGSKFTFGDDSVDVVLDDAARVFDDIAGSQDEALTGGADQLWGFGGSEIVRATAAHGGNDLYYGNVGSDQFLANAASGNVGTDTIYGGQDADVIDYAWAAGGFNAGAAAAGAIVAYGNLGNDSIAGTAGADTVFGGQGDDLIAGNAGNDELHGNLGDDVITGGAGNDVIYGNQGADTITATVGDGNDTVYGGQDADTITYTGAGAALLYGNMGADTIVATANNDTVYGGQDNDVIDGAAGHDVLFGNLGADTITVGAGNDTVHGGDGDDVIVLNHVGEYGDNATLLTGGGAASAALRTTGTMFGGEGNDTLRINSLDTDETGVAIAATDLTVHFDDLYDIENVVVRDAGLSYNVTLDFTEVFQAVNLDATGVTYAGNTLAIVGTAAADTIIGGAGADSVKAAAGDDYISTGAGDDIVVMTSTTGADTILAGDGVDTLNYSDPSITSAVTVNIGTGVASGAAQISGFENITGSAQADSLTGDANNNVIIGGGGNDTITGGQGVDTVTGGLGSDTFVFGANSVVTGAVVTPTIAAAPAIGAGDTFVSALGALDTVMDFTTGVDKLDLSAFALTRIADNNVVANNGEVSFVSGAWNAATATFTAAAAGAGADMMVVFDADTSGGISQGYIVLVGAGASIVNGDLVLV